MIRHFLRNLFRRDRVERELSDELDGFVDLVIEEKVAQGMSPDEASRAARLELGRVEHVKDNVRDVRVGVWLDALRQDSALRRPDTSQATRLYGDGRSHTRRGHGRDDGDLQPHR